MIITTATRTHLTSSQVDEEIDSEEVVSDGAALAIASWWQSPSGHGATFAQFASTGSVNADALIDAAEYEMSNPLNSAWDEDDRERNLAYLSALKTWVAHQAMLRLNRS